MWTRNRIIATFVIVTVMIAGAAWLTRTPPVETLNLTDRYDYRFKKYSKRYFGVLFDWRWIKAQSMVESSLRRNVRSDRGAIGIMQLLPDTFGEVIVHYPEYFSITDPKWNIAAGVAYDRYLLDRWRQWVSPDQSLQFALASYNAGLTGTLRAQKRAMLDGADADDWQAVAPYVPVETRHYVNRIHELMGLDQ